MESMTSPTKRHQLLLWTPTCRNTAQPPGLGVRGPEGDIRHGVPRIRPRQGRDGRRGDGVQEAQGGGRLPARGHRGDDRLPFAGIPDGAPQEDPHEQHDRTLNREIRRRTRVVGSFPDGNSALMLICARIRYVTANEWSTRRYLDMSRLDDNLQEAN